MTEINFVSSEQQVKIIEIGIDIIKFGNTSITLKSAARNMMNAQTTIVNLDENGKPKAQGKSSIDFVKRSIIKKIRHLSNSTKLLNRGFLLKFQKFLGQNNAPKQ